MANGNCTTCKNSKLDERWGEMKCLKYGHKIYYPTLVMECHGYESNQNKEKLNEPRIR